MRSLVLSAVLVASACASTPPPAPIVADYVFEHVNVVPMNEEVVLPERAVAVRDGRIVGIVEQDEARAIEAHERIDGAGRYVLPGLADMHEHLRSDPPTTFDVFLANGVTTIRNMNDTDGGFDHVQLRADLAAGRLDGPRYLISGPFLDPRSLRSLADVEPMLDIYARRGFDYVKVHDDLPQDIYDAVIEGARARGMVVTGHAQRDKPLAQTLRMYSMEHAEEFIYVSGQEALADPVQRAEIVREMAASGIYLCPTLLIYQVISVYLDDAQFAAFTRDPNLAYVPAETRAAAVGDRTNEYRRRTWPPNFGAQVSHDIELLNQLVLDLQRAGVPLILGSDAFGGIVPGFSIHQELRMLVNAGLSPYEALRTGTVNVAAYLHESEDAGTLEVGKRADFFLVDGDPLADIANAGRVRGVFSHGRWRDERELAGRLTRARAHYADPVN